MWHLLGMRLMQEEKVGAGLAGTGSGEGKMRKKATFLLRIFKKGSLPASTEG